MYNLYHQGRFTQWAADNADHNKATLDGKHTFHGMGMISVTTGSFGSNVNKPQQKIRRQKFLKSNVVVAGKGVEIVQFVSSSKPGIFPCIFKPLEDMAVDCILPINSEFDMIWHCHYFRNMSKMRPCWSKFMLI